MQRETRERLHAWLRAHDGVISRTQARQLAITPSALRRLVDAGHLRRVSPGIFVDPSAVPNPRTTLRAAVLAAGQGAVVSHRSAAWLWDLVERPPARPSLTIPRARRIAHPTITVHRTTIPPPHRRHAGFAVTDPTRTLLDMASTTAAGPFDSMVDRAISSRLVSVGRLQEATTPDVHQRQAGVRALRRRLAARGLVEAPTPSVLESHMGRLLRRRRAIPSPQTELTQEEGRYRLDYAWPAVGLAVEVDGYVWHASAAQMRHDHDRRNHLALHWTFLIFTWQQVLHEPEAVMDEIISTYQALQQRAGPTPREA
ncbi:MAG: type IV toxin-antitoxin system AbiEi family antitoxin domain-containing protein [Actinomycetota bacterium]|nr:type IV toxin-antitoxin system AbiEi family antitoxin domain-containing protein [Actinomycetota bacterium]